MNKISRNLQAFKIAINSHDRENPSHSAAYGIGVSAFDLERLGFEEGEELWSGIRIEIDSRTSGNFRVLCDGEDHDEDKEIIEEENKRLSLIGNFV